MKTDFSAHRGLHLAALILSIALSAPLLAVAAEPARVLVYGDSNTWGWIPTPQAFPTERYPRAERWPQVMQHALTPRVEVLTDALNGRTTDIDPPRAVGQIPAGNFNGMRDIANAVARELPLDLVVIMLGTNDLASDQPRLPEQIAAGAVALAQRVRDIDGGVLTTYAAPKVLLVVPPPLGDTSRTAIGGRFDEGSRHKSRELAAAYRQAAAAKGFAVYDAGQAVTEIGGIDGIHLTAAQQQALGQAIAAQVQALLPTLSSSQPGVTP